MNEQETERIVHFVVFCLEAYKQAEGIMGAEAAGRFDRYGVIGYLSESFDMLHTLGSEALVADIRDYIRRRTEV